MSRRRDPDNGYGRSSNSLYLNPPRALGRRLIFSRSRIHPFLLVPVFLFGLAFSRFHSPPLPNPIYHGDLYKAEDGDAYLPFLPADAPPLNPLEEDEIRRDMARNGDGRPRAGRGTGGDNGDWDSEPDEEEGTARPSYLVSLAGYLYFPPSAPLIPIKIPKAAASPQRSTRFDNLLDLPPKPVVGARTLRGGVSRPPPVLDWVHPASPFKAPIPPLPPPANYPPPITPRADRIGRPQPPFRQLDTLAGEHRLGANAEAMRRAALDGSPFKPVKPAEMQADRRLADVLQRRKAAQAVVEAAKLERANAPRIAPVFAPGGEKQAMAPLPVAKQAPLRRPANRGADQDVRAAREQIQEQRAQRVAAQQAAGPPRERIDRNALKAAEPPSDLDPLSQAEAEVEMEDAELLAIFESLTDEERMLLTPDELEVLLELENEMHRFAFVDDEEQDLDPPTRLAKRGFETVEESESEEDSIPENAASTSMDSHSPPKLVKRDEPAAPTTKNRIHPIAFLVKEAEEKWEGILERQSQTLFQAVVEYQRRYGRKPPLGFDAWWRYAMQNRVILVDEYDQIDEDIRPFFSLPADEIRARAKALSTSTTLPQQTDTFTIHVKDGRISSSGPYHRSQRAEDTQDLMGEFAESLPDMSMTFASHDLPVIAISGEAKVRHEHFSKSGHLLELARRNEMLENSAYQPWQGLCRPNSTSRRYASGQSTGRPHGPSFVSTEHLSAMDICRHPEIQSLNGFTSSEGPRPYLLYPLFSWSKTSMHSDILSAPIDKFSELPDTAPSWNKKTHNKVMWRGATTGTFARRGSTWRTSQRSRLVSLTSDRDGERDVLYADPELDDAIRRFKGPAVDINAFYFDVGFSGSPVQCDTEDKTCEIMVQELKFLPAMSKEYSRLFKYVLDVDSNGPSPDFHRLIQSGSVVFKSTIFPEWYTRRIMPWFHYVPIKSDYADLTDVAAFFIGAPDGSGSHDDLAERIAANGRKWAKEHWREADMAAYQFRLYLEYARLVSREAEGSHDFVME
ncbi:hypothetical protein P7C70_g776, partial [Phenoliferia sp. Uapishka_3]